MSDKEEARPRREEEHKKLIERLDSHDCGPAYYDRGVGEGAGWWDKARLYPPPVGWAFDPIDYGFGDGGDGGGE